MRSEKLFGLVVPLACVAGARKGKGEGKSGARGKGKGSVAPAASPLFISPFSFAGEQKNRHWFIFNYTSVIT